MNSTKPPPSSTVESTSTPTRGTSTSSIACVWRRAELLQRLHSFQLAEGHEPVPRSSGRNRDPREERLIEAYPDPHHRLNLQTDLATVRHYDPMIARLETQLVATTRRFASRDYALLQTIPGIGQALALTILYEVDTIDRFPTVQDFC